MIIFVYVYNAQLRLWTLDERVESFSTISLCVCMACIINVINFAVDMLQSNKQINKQKRKKR